MLSNEKWFNMLLKCSVELIAMKLPGKLFHFLLTVLEKNFVDMKLTFWNIIKRY